jgi:hypothetical protein
MPKQRVTLSSFAGGINNIKDPRDIATSEAGFIKNMSIDAQGKITSAGSILAHSESPVDGTTNLTNYISNRGGSGANAAVLDGGGGYNLFYFESDLSATADESIDVSIGTSAGNVTFVNPTTVPDGDTGGGGGGGLGGPPS